MRSDVFNGDFDIADMGVESTESDKPKIKARSSLYDGDERKIA